MQLVTSAVREIPLEWRDIPRLKIVVSIDGLQPEHDARRTPATYDRILKHIAGHRLEVHCTITRQQVNRPGYIDEFLAFWSGRPEVQKIMISLYTPQLGEVSAERLLPADREHVIHDLLALRLRYPKLALPKELIAAFATPPAVARRMRVRPHDDDDFGRPEARRSRRASSAARPIAATAGASRRPGSRPSRGIACSA